jgi:hypothetical protein
VFFKAKVQLLCKEISAENVMLALILSKFAHKKLFILSQSFTFLILGPFLIAKKSAIYLAEQ